MNQTSIRHWYLLILIVALTGTLTSAPVSAQSPGGTYTIVGYGDKCLDIPNRNAKRGQDLHMWACHGDANQQWTLNSKGQIKSMGKCLDVEGPYKGNGVAVQVWDCSSVPQHRWQISRSGQIRSYDGRCLDVRGPSKKNGTKVQLWNCSSPLRSNQQWGFVPVQTPVPEGNPNDKLSHQEAVRILRSGGITRITSSANCFNDRNNPKCTTLEGIRRASVQGLVDFKKRCDRVKGDCTIVVTGGTEYGHSGCKSGDDRCSNKSLKNHWNGYKIDIKWSFDGSNHNFAGRYIRDNFNEFNGSVSSWDYYRDPSNGDIHVLEWGGATHWDICFDCD